MELNNDFRVSVPPLDAWKVLTDVERIAPLLPGAQLQEIEGDEYRGIVRVKVGPITAQYKGTATFLEQDQSSGHLVLKASGRDTRGQGNASATITVNMAPEGDGTKVGVVTDLTITGKVAQFGRGVLAEVTEKLINQFVDALEADIGSGGNSDGQKSVDDGGDSAPIPAAADQSATPPASDEPADSGAPAAESDGSTGSSETAGSEAAQAPASSGPRQINQPEPEPVDLLDAAGGSVAKRMGPLAGVAVLLFVLFVLRRRRRARAAAAARLAVEQERGAVQQLTRKAAKRAQRAAASAELPDLAAAQEMTLKAVRRLQEAAASADLPDLAAAQDLTRQAVRRAQRAVAVELRELISAQEATLKAAKRARQAARRK